MIKIITALGTPNLNNKLKHYNEFKVVGNDILYIDGILELLEIENDIDYIIISEILTEKIDIRKYIEKIYKLNKKIKIIFILKEKNNEQEQELIRYGIHDIFYSESDILEIINLLKNKNIEVINKELRMEIENLKKMIIEKNSKKTVKKQKVNNFNTTKKCKIISMIGTNGIGKTSCIYFIANVLKKKNKVLIIDFNYKENDLNFLFNIKKEYIEEDEVKNIKNSNYIKKLNENLHVLNNIHFLINENKIIPEDLIKEIRTIKNNYDYIFIDANIFENTELNKLIFDLCTDIFFLTNINKLQQVKDEKLLNKIHKITNIKNEKFHYVLYKYNWFDFMLLKKEQIKNIKKIYLGKIKKINHYSLYIKHSNFIKYNFYYKYEIKRIMATLDKKR